MARTTTRKTTGKKRGPKKKQEPLKVRFNNIINDEKFKLISGAFLLLFAALLLVSFTSSLFSWKNDQLIVELNWWDYIFNTEIHIDNAAGKIGAVLSHIFIFKFFGIASFGFILIFSIYGLKLLRIKTLPVKKTLKYTVIAMIWLSVTLSFISGESYLLLGGGFGYNISGWLISLIGGLGLFFVLLLSVFAFLLFTVEGFLIKAKIFIKNIIKTKKVNTAIDATKNEYHEVKLQQNNSEITQKTEEELELERIRQQNFVPKDKGVVIDLDTNEPLETTQTRNYKLGDDGNEVDNDLGFEVESTIKEETDNDENESSDIVDNNKSEDENQENDTTDEAVNSAQNLENKLYGRLALEVHESSDIVVDNIQNPQLVNYDPTLDLSNYTVPPVELLEEHKAQNSSVTKEELLRNKNKIVETLKNYKIEIKKIKATIGPTITLYEIIPAPGVRISKIRNLEDDIALSLAALGIRIIAPMPGRGTIGIEVPNEKPEIVSFRSVVKSAAFQTSKMELPIALGKTISNESYVFDLVKMPHILVAGATGQGKSVGLNAMLASILYKKHPSQIKFVLVDPKKVELTLYEKIAKHFLACLPDEEEAIVTDNKKVVQTVSSLNVEMDDRYILLKKAKVRHIKEYNAKFINRKLNPHNGHRYLPYIVLVIDEFADLIMTAGKEIELPIARLAQLARAIGIHLIVATQRPSTNIITGTIKANFPARVAFKVASMIDSRTILDSPGANQLIGRGDMLMTRGSDLVRLQCAFIDTPELEKITDYVEHQQGFPSPFYLPEPPVEGDNDEPGKVDLTKRDELFEEAARIVVLHQQGSTSLIQRKMSIGYNRAGRIVDQLEAAGIVGPSKGSKARDVYFTDEYSLEQFFSTLPN